MILVKEAKLIQEDRLLWKRMREGDKEALATLFRRHYALLYDYGLKLSQQEELAKDGIQEVFAYIWEKRENISTVNSVRAYLMVAVRRHLLKASSNSNKGKPCTGSLSGSKRKTFFLRMNLIRDDQLDLFTLAHTDLLADRRLAAADRICEEPQYTRTNNEAFRKHEYLGAVAGNCANSNSLFAAQNIDLHVEKVLVFYAHRGNGLAPSSLPGCAA
ncbi:hypothetical protein L0337_14255 [candidate division KSB1 bacterium]|nr:hypothetical protein [candidate division KSB1 bacterium]